MTETNLLNPLQLRNRWGDKVSIATLQKWRSNRKNNVPNVEHGPEYFLFNGVKYSLHKIEEYEKKKGMVPA